ncbi:MAG: DapH/DapD/GlmU-related protein [Patescibacteria group bacterium]
MKAYIIQDRKKIEPFQKRASQLLIKNKKLEDLQKEIVLSSGLIPVKINNFSEINDNNEYLVVGNEVYFEQELLKEFIKTSQKKRCKTVCAIKTGIFTKRTISSIQKTRKHESHLEYNLYYYPAKNFRDAGFKPVVIDVEENFEKLIIPKHIQKDGEYLIPFTTKPIVQINHWANLWSANLIAIFSNIATIQKKHKLKIFLTAIKKLSLNRWQIASSLNKIGKNCDIHPTAYIEASIIGKNVTIGAGSVIRASIIGDNSFIGNGVTIEASSLGNNCTILNGHILYCTLMPSVFSVTHMISASIIGEDSFIGSGAVLTDFRFDNKPVNITIDHEKINSENIFLGCGLGNNVYLGSGCVVAPGRTIPSDSHIVMGKNKIISKIDEDGQIPDFRVI